jgi:hypothetical protein
MARKMLEERTGWRYEFSKNEKFEYDLVVIEWDEEPEDPTDKRVLGYVEIERSRGEKPTHWKTGDIPDCWTLISFLKRKIYQHHGWWGEVIPEHDRTVYLKFNHDMTNCFAAPIEAVHADGWETWRSDGSYLGSTHALELDDPRISHGIDECVAFIMVYLRTKAEVSADE